MTERADRSQRSPSRRACGRNLCFPLPAWLRRSQPGGRAARQAVPDDRGRMARAIDLAEANVAAGTGGPFGAAVYDLRSGRPVAAGANLVVFGRCACLHAEIVALALAQQRQGTHDLAAAGEFGLYTSTEPCAMCLGAVAWSGVRRLVCGASGGDAEAIGFDEGPKPAAWPRALRRRGIDVRRGVLRAAALDVLRRYRAAGGPIYNPGPRAAAGDRR